MFEVFLKKQKIRCDCRSYHACRGEKDARKYADVGGFRKSAAADDIAAHDFILTLGRFAGAEEQ